MHLLCYTQAEHEEEEEEPESENEEEYKLGYDELPKPAWKPPPIIPKEEPRAGANKKTYFVCNDRKYLKMLHLELTYFCASCLAKQYFSLLDIGLVGCIPPETKHMHITLSMKTQLLICTDLEGT